MRSLVISIFLYSCESMTLTAELKKRTETFGMRCYQKLLNTSCNHHGNNEDVRRKIQSAIGKHVEVLTLVKKRNLRCFLAHLKVFLLSKTTLQLLNSYVKTILRGRVKGKRTKKTKKQKIRKGRQKKLKTRPGGKRLL